MRKLRDHESGVQETEEEDARAVLQTELVDQDHQGQEAERDGSRLPAQAPTCILCGSQDVSTGVTIDGERRPCCRSCRRAYDSTRRIHHRASGRSRAWTLRGGEE